MLNFLRKNIIFFSVSGLILVISLVLAVVDIMMYCDIQDARTREENSKREYEDLLKPNSKVYKGNAEKFENDAVFAMKEARKLQRRFGQPNREYFLALLGDLNLGEEKEDEVRALFRKHFEEHQVKKGKETENFQASFKNFTSPSDRVFFEFIDAFKTKLALYLEPAKEGEDPENRKPSQKAMTKVNTAFDNFIKRMIQRNATAEDLANCNFMDDIRRIHYDIIAEAFGLPRIMQPYQCKNYLESMLIAIRDQRRIPGVTSLEKIREFTFKDYESRVPANSEVPDIILSMRVYEDIFHILTDVANKALLPVTRAYEQMIKQAEEKKEQGQDEAAKLRREEQEKLAELALEVTGVKLVPPANPNERYQKFRCTLNLKTNLSTVRLLVNSLHEAYRNNKVCVVRWVSIKGSSDKELEELKKLLNPSSDSLQENTIQETRPRRGRRNRRAQQTTIRQNNSANPLAPYLDPYGESYAKAIVGKARRVEAEIDFEYVIYTGDQVYKHSNSN